MKRLFILLAVSTALTSCWESLDDRIEREAKDFTAKHCPQMVDNYTRLDSTTYEKGTRTYRYWYTVIGELDTPDAFEYMNSQSEEMKRNLAENARNTPSMKETLEAEINLEYVYYSQTSGRVAFRLPLTPADYK